MYAYFFLNVHRYIFKRTHIYRGLDTKHIKENKVIYKNINRRTKKTPTKLIQNYIYNILIQL